MATHIQIHRSAIAGATPSGETMLEGEVAVNLTDKKLFVKGATGELITLAEPQTHADTNHVTSFNGETGVVTFNDYVTTFNGSTGAIQGMSSFNGLTGDVTSGISFSIHGITFSDNTFQRSASQNGFRYKTGSASDAGNDAGRLNINMDTLGEIDFVSINTTDLNGTNLTPLFTLLQQRGGNKHILTTIPALDFIHCSTKRINGSGYR